MPNALINRGGNLRCRLVHINCTTSCSYNLDHCSCYANDFTQTSEVWVPRPIGKIIMKKFKGQFT